MLPQTFHHSTIMKFTSVARLMGIFSPVSVGMSTMTPHNACDDDDDDDDDHGDCDAERVTMIP